MNQNTGKFSGEALVPTLAVYAVTDRHWLKPGQKLADQVRETLEAGATFVQLREKDLPENSEELRQEALEIQELCREYGVPFVLDDDAALAAEIGCDGIHVGQEDMEAGAVRELVGPDKILGVSAQTVDEALLAEERGADYLGVGAVFPTGSKDDAIEVDHDTLEAICNAVSIPVIAIGGITVDNVKELAGRGLVGVAVISAIFGADDIGAATRELSRNVDKYLLGK